jgi:hypothetical protein
MVLFKTKKLEVTEYGYLLETAVYFTLTIWLRRRMVRFDKYTYYKILNA